MGKMYNISANFKKPDGEILKLGIMFEGDVEPIARLEFAKHTKEYNGGLIEIVSEINVSEVNVK